LAFQSFIYPQGAPFEKSLFSSSIDVQVGVPEGESAIVSGRFSGAANLVSSPAVLEHYTCTDIGKQVLKLICVSFPEVQGA
jgi:hypothetical protein